LKLYIHTPEGAFLAHYSRQGLARVNFPSGDRSAKPDETVGQPVSAQVKAWHGLTTTALKEVLSGRQPRKLPPLDLSCGTEFQRLVWNAMLKIPAGGTSSYSGIAGDIGRPKAVRAVGGACGANPIPVLIPCHRVLAAGGRLGGFSSGLDWKRKLLTGEGVLFL
jgi:methylated-DNA-[protein]-cysteine S-methyltransferase